MSTFQRGDSVLVEAFGGELLPRVATTGVVSGADFQVVWVCREDEWALAHQEGREPDAVPWPAEDVRAAATT